MPNANGSNFIIGTGQLTNADLKGYSMADFKGWVLLSTADPRFFLAASAPPNGVSICTTSDRQRVFTVVDKVMQGMNASSDPYRWFLSDSEEARVRYLPEGNVLVLLAMNDRQIIVRPLNLMEELNKAGKEYLFVLSQPSTHAKAGTEYQYQMDVKSKSAGITYKLESAPEGMRLSSRGELRWSVPTTAAGKSIPVIINVKNASGKELFHSFDLLVD
jgi:hypothetical protein